MTKDPTPQQQQDVSSSSSSVDTGKKKKTTKRRKLFYTTSDMLKTMNESIVSIDDGSDRAANDRHRPRVELQRRMPDGSTRRVTDQDMEAADMDSKLKQAAEQVADMTPEEKVKWAKQQRMEGNILYQEGDYREAMDVYLTCLVSKTTQEDDDDDNTDDFTTHVFLPIMNNLAQCSLQLGMYRKAIQFCTMALNDDEHVVAVQEQTQGTRQRQQLVAKLYFRRGRALRLSGEYDAARNDLKTALGMLEMESSTEFRSVQREMQLIQRAEMEERRSRKRQERAMQRLLVADELDSEAATTDDDLKGVMGTLSESMDQDGLSGLYPGPMSERRTYSTLTAATRPNGDEEEQAGQERSYWRWYLSMIARAAEKLLIVLGDEEYSNRGCNDRKTD